MRVARVGLVAPALCLLCLLAVLSSQPVMATDAAYASYSNAPIHWKTEAVGVGFPQEFSSEYVVSSGPGNPEWTDYPARDLFVYDFSLGVTRQLTSTPDTENSAALWGHEVLYATGPNPFGAQDGPWSVSLYDIKSGGTRIVSHYEKASYVGDMQATDGYAAWTVTVGDSIDIFLYDFTSGIAVSLSTEDTHQVHGLSLSDGKLAWIDGSSLFLYDLASRVRTVVSTSEDDSSYQVSVAGGRVAWTRGGQLRLYDIASRHTEVVTDGADDFDLWAGHVVWMQTLDVEAGSNTTEIYLRDLPNGQQQRLTSNSAADMNPQVSDRFVVWMQGDSRGASLLAYDLQSGSTSKINPDDMGAAGFILKGDSVAWYQWRGAGDVYFSHPVAFLDVEPSAPFGTAIEYLANEGIIGGYPDGTFRSDGPVTRQQFAKMIVKTLGLHVTGSEICPFGDVAAQIGADPLYPSKYVAVCARAGITTGKTATTFSPGTDITREQLITMVTRAADLADPPATYAPGFTSERFSLLEHYQNARKAAYAGLLYALEGMGSSSNFSAASTRGECAQLLYNLRGRPDVAGYFGVFIQDGQWSGSFQVAAVTIDYLVKDVDPLWTPRFLPWRMTMSGCRKA